ncbi:hypothetical protein CISG_03093 [Coccidioides immitis RMSCC 3703]|uniref:Uncharacterized protein n=2 Tax=Coccidioides immitis TaxID=5501 RepID=A0A0J8QJ02_COCIT|nr:hypothetical protein CIRG_07977 [Coccidioides immitis RMSCC 2394]KMU72445.1 hypothetical protein CISG_03093 [Coccidioides immitis RMSCC 3703]
MAGKRIVYALIPFVQSQPRNSWINRGMHILPAPLLGPFSQTVICCTDNLCYCSASRPHPSSARESAESGVIFIRLLRIKPRIQRTIENVGDLLFSTDDMQKARESEHPARLPEPTFVVLVCCLSWPETRAEPCVFWTVFQVYKVTLSLSPPRNPVKVAGKNNFDYTKDPGGNRRRNGGLRLPPVPRPVRGCVRSRSETQSNYAEIHQTLCRLAQMDQANAQRMNGNMRWDQDDFA